MFDKKAPAFYIGSRSRTVSGRVQLTLATLLPALLFAAILEDKDNCDLVLRMRFAESDIGRNTSTRASAATVTSNRARKGTDCSCTGGDSSSGGGNMSGSDGGTGVGPNDGTGGSTSAEANEVSGGTMGGAAPLQVGSAHVAADSVRAASTCTRPAQLWTCCLWLWGTARSVTILELRKAGRSQLHRLLHPEAQTALQPATGRLPHLRWSWDD